MRRSKPRLYIKPQWVGWNGTATMAYVMTSCDPWDKSQGGRVEVSVSKPAMANKWNFRTSHAQVLRSSFFDFLARMGLRQ